MICVLDASVTLAWIFPGEATPAIQSLFNGILAGGAVVPPLWRIEVANGLSMGIRRQRITMDLRNRSINDLLGMPIMDDADGQDEIWGRSMILADRYQLTNYDAVYLELAIRLTLPLATLDQKLRNAASLAGLQLLGL